MKCPNINDPDWIKLEKNHPDLAYFYWDKFDGEIPADLLSGDRDSLNKKLTEGFLKDWNIDVQDYESIKDALGSDSTQMVDLISKFIALEKGESLSKSTAFFAFRMLGKQNNKVISELRYRVNAWDKYKEKFDFYKKELFDQTGFIKDKKDWVNIIRDKVIVDYLAETIVEYDKNPEEFEAITDRQWTQDDFTFFAKLARAIRNFFKKIGVIKVNKEESQKIAKNIITQLSHEVLTQEYDMLNYSLEEGQIQKHYNKTIESDPIAKKLVEYHQENEMVLTGSLALRKAGTVYRTSEETLHDLDFVVPYKTSDVEVNQDVLREIKKWQGSSLEASGNKTLDIIENLHWLSNFKMAYPSYKIIRGFYGSEHGSYESFTLTGVVNGEFYDSNGTHEVQNNDGTIKMVKHKKGDWIEDTGYIVDHFIRLEPNQEEHENYFKLWKEIMIAKLKMNRAKDITDYKNFVPFTKSKDSYNFHYKDWVFQTGNNPITEKNKEDKGETVYYHKQPEFSITEDEFKLNLRRTVYRDVVKSKGWVSKNKKIQGERAIKHVYKNASLSAMKDPEARRNAVIHHYNSLSTMNKRYNNGEQPFIITKLSSTFVTSNNQRIEIPNYTVEFNDDYLDVEWEKAKASQVNLPLNNKSEAQLNIDFGKNFKQKATPIDTGFDTVEDLNDKINILKKSLPMAEVSFNGDLPNNVYGRLITKKGQSPLVEINPRYNKRDTAIHEFGHLYIDLLGGMNNNFVKRGRKLLEGSDVEFEVTAAYPELSGEMLDKEILTTAVGREGADLYDLKKQSPFKAWIKIFFNKIRLALNLKGNVALELAQQMLNDKVNKSQLNSSLNDVIQNSKTNGYEEYASKEDNLVSDMAIKILDRIKILQSKYKKTNNEKFKKEIEKLVKILDTNRDAKGIIRYTEETISRSTSIISRINKIKMDEESSPIEKAEDIRQLGVYLKSFSLIPDVKELYLEVKRNPKTPEERELVKLMENAETEEKLNTAAIKVSEINQEYSILRRDNLTDILLSKSNRMKDWYRDEYEKEFYAEVGGYSNAKKEFGKELQDRKEDYIAEKLAENSDLIQRAEKNYIREILKAAPKDIEGGIFAQYAVDPRSLDDSIIQTAVELLDNADYEAMRRFLDERNSSLDVYEEYYQWKGRPSDQTVLYDGIIEKIDGKETNHIVGKYLSSFKDAVRQFYEDNPDATKAEIKKFYMDTKGKYINPQWVQLEKLRESHPNGDHPKLRMYDYLMTKFKEKDSMVNPGQRLNIDVDKYHPTFKLPSIEKTAMESMYEQGLFTSVKQSVRRGIKRTTEDLEFGDVPEMSVNFKNVLINEAGKENQHIPIYYRGNIENINKQSFDLMGIHLMDHHQLINYQEKNKIGSTLELMAEQAGEREVNRRENGKLLINPLGTRDLTSVSKAGIESNSYKALHSIIQDRLYGISSIPIGNIGGANLNKLGDGLMAWTGHTLLIMNKMAAGVNILQGKYQNFLEGAGGTIYNRKNLRVAEKLVAKDSVHMGADWGRNRPKAITNLFVELFDAQSDFSGLKYRLSEDNKLKRLVSSSTGHILNHAGENYIQSTLMYAVLDATKVKDASGNKIPLHEAYERQYKTKDGNWLSEKEKSNLSDSSILTENVRLAVKEGIEISRDFEKDISRKLKQTVKILHGNYDSNNQAMAQRYAMGKLAFMLRKWLVPGVQRRWRGVKYSFKDNESRSIHDVAYDPLLNKSVEGYYSTTIRFLWNAKKELKQFEFGLVSGQWNNLTDEERSNIRKTIIDISTMISSMAASSFLAGLAEGVDDEDKDIYYSLAYLFRRHYSELRFYSSPPEGMKILSSPAASLSMIQKTSSFIDQAFTAPTERYVKGPKKGDLKLYHKGAKLTPVLSQTERNIRDIYNWLERN